MTLDKYTQSISVIDVEGQTVSLALGDTKKTILNALINKGLGILLGFEFNTEGKSVPKQSIIPGISLDADATYVDAVFEMSCDVGLKLPLEYIDAICNNLIVLGDKYISLPNTNLAQQQNIELMKARVACIQAYIKTLHQTIDLSARGVYDPDVKHFLGETANREQYEDCIAEHWSNVDKLGKVTQALVGSQFEPSELPRLEDALQFKR